MQKKLSRVFWLSSGIFLLFFISCKEAPTPTDMSLEGQWIIQTARRNGKLTKTLKDGFFEFYADGNMKTNILGDTLMSAYTRADNVISQTGEVAIDYVIQYIGVDSLHLSAEIRNFQFDFYTIRPSNEETNSN